MPPRDDVQTPPRNEAREPRTPAGLALLEVLSVQDQANGESVPVDWAHAVLAIEDQAAALPGITREQLAAALPAVLNFRWFIYPVGHPKWDAIADAILTTLPRSAAPALDVERLFTAIDNITGQQWDGRAIAAEYARLADPSRSDASGEAG